MKEKKVAAALVLILLAAFALRMYNLTWETYGYGEIEIKEAAEAYAKGNFVNNYYLFDNPPLGKYLFAGSIMAFGESETAFRIVSLFFGMLTIAGIFLLTRKMYDSKMALLATSITAFSILQIQLSRYTQFETILSFLYVLIAYFLWQATHENKKYSSIFLGVSIGLAIATKFTSIIVLVAVIVYALYIRHIKISVRPNFSINIRNWLIKSLIIALVVFLLAWPFGFSRLHTEANISVDYGGTIRSQQVDSNIPIILLSFSRRVFTSVSDSVQHPLAMEIPVLNYFLLYITKEILLILPLLAAGIYFAIKKPMKPDTLIAIFIITFLVLLSFQRTLISYRHIVPLVPFFSIFASRWLYAIKDNRKKILSIALVAMLLLIYAALSSPSYALSYSPLKNTFGITDSESRFSEGMNDTISYLHSNCSSVFASNFYRIMIENYYKNVTSSYDSSAECAVKGNTNDVFDVGRYLSLHNCTVSKTISKNSLDLVYIYSC